MLMRLLNCFLCIFVGSRPYAPGNPTYPRPELPTRPPPGKPPGPTPSTGPETCTKSYSAATRVRGELMLFRVRTLNCKVGIGSLFDLLCVNTIRWPPFWRSRVEVSCCTFGFGAIILAPFAQLLFAACLQSDNLKCVFDVSPWANDDTRFTK